MISVDPLARLFDKYKITPKKAFWGSVILFGLIERIIVPIFLHYPNILQHGWLYFLNYFAGFYQNSIVAPIGYATYIWTMYTPDYFNRTFSDICVHKRNTKKRLSVWRSTYEQSLSRQSLFYFVLFLTIFFTAEQTYTYIFLEPKPWFGENTIHFVFATIFSAFGYYIVLWIAIREVVAVVWVKKFFDEFRGEIKITPSHPDQCGGLGSIGLHATRFGLFVFALALSYMIQIPLTIDYNAIKNIYGIIQLSGFAVFIMLVLYIFYRLIIPAHNEMSQSKIRILNSLSEKIREQIDQISINREALSASRNIDFLERSLDFIRKEHPTWPIKLRTLGGVTVTSLVEIFSLIVSIIGLLLKT